jgi:hypothetical protein
MRRGLPFQREKPPRLAPRKTVLRDGTQDSFGSLDDGDSDEMRRVLREVGAIEGKEKGWSARRPIEGRFFKKEPVWKKRLRKLKSSLAPEHAKATAFVKSVSFDDVSLNHPSGADDFSAAKKKKAQTPEANKHKPSPFKRVGSNSSFSDFFRKIADEDLFSLDTPSYLSEQTSVSTADENSSITSYPRVKKVPKMQRTTKTPASCDVMDQEQKTNYMCSTGDSVMDDLRLVADLLISDATCRTCLTDDAIPQHVVETRKGLD